MSADDFDAEAHDRQHERDMARWRADRVDAAWDATYSDVPASATESYGDHLAEENEIGRTLAARRAYLDQQRSDRAMQRYDQDCARPTSPEELDAAHQRLAPLLAGPVCPPKPSEPTDLYDGLLWAIQDCNFCIGRYRTNSAPEAGSGAHRAGRTEPGPDAVAPRPGRWRRLRRWISAME